MEHAVDELAGVVRRRIGDGPGDAVTRRGDDAGQLRRRVLTGNARRERAERGRRAQRREPAWAGTVPPPLPGKSALLTMYAICVVVSLPARSLAVTVNVLLPIVAVSRFVTLVTLADARLDARVVVRAGEVRRNGRALLVALRRGLWYEVAVGPSRSCANGAVCVCGFDRSACGCAAWRRGRDPTRSRRDGCRTRRSCRCRSASTSCRPSAAARGRAVLCRVREGDLRGRPPGS